MAVVDYKILGKLEVRRDGVELDLGAFRQRALLALLLSEPNTVFSTDRIIDALWADDGSIDRQNSLWVYVSGLRKALEPDREKRADPTVLLTQSPGYLLAVEPDEIDAVRFERMVGEGRALAQTDPAAASMVFSEALALWRGKAFEDFGYESFIQTEIARLETMRQVAVEARIDADLDRGMARELLSELETLVRQHPLREETAGQYMVALTRAGRQADALRAYQSLRNRLGEELGLEPSRQIRLLEEQIVTGELALPRGERTVTSGAGAAIGLGVRGYELRDELGEGGFGVVYRAYQPALGREVAIKVIRKEFANDPNFIRRFEAEAQLIARLEHPHIVPLYDFWREPDVAYLVMRFVPGGSLAEVLDDHALTVEQTAQLLDQVGRALEAAHAAGVVHRDIKPDNILLDELGNAYLSDFGIALETAESSSGAVLTTLGPPYAAPEALDRGPVSASSDIFSLGVLAAHALSGLGGDVESVRGALDPQTMRVVDRATSADPSDRFTSVQGFISAMQEAMGTEEPVRESSDLDAENPYMGLRSFDASDSAVFFGRERLVERLVARLSGAGSKSRFTAIVGPSGSGKSSVAKAGLIPALRRGALVGSSDWFLVSLTPGAHPFEELEAALHSVAVTQPASLLEDLLAENGIDRAVRRILPDDGSQVLLLIDQFEELFTLADTDTAQSFLDALAAAVQAPHNRVRVVVTLRADFYDRPLRHLQIGELLREGTEVITPLTPEELERAITGPTEPLGVRYEPGLVSEMVRDVADRTGALPLLQYALTELFDARSGSVIEHDSYRALGGVSGALVERAEGLFAQLGEHTHDAVRQVFLRLVTFGEGAEDTRRRVLRTELEQLALERQVLDGVLDTFGRHRLLSFDRDPVTRGPTIEISHEALLREWLRLRNWMDEARDDVRSQRRLADAMGEWVASGEQEDFLLRGGRLDELRGWAALTALPLSRPEREFLDASIDERDRTLEEDIAREQRTTEAERVAQRRLRQLAGAGLVGIVVAALAVFGISQWRSASTARDDVTVERDRAAVERDRATVERDRANEARDEATEARNDRDSLLVAAEFVTASESAFLEEPELALLYGVEAIRSTSDLGFATEGAVDSVHWALQRLGVQFEIGPDPDITVRSGPYGLTGVFTVSPADLIDLAEATTSRRLVDEECSAVTEAPCTEAVEVPDDLPLQFGDENYRDELPSVLPGLGERRSAGTTALAGTTVSLAISSSVGSHDGLKQELEDGLKQELERFSVFTGIGVDLVEGADIALALEAQDGDVLAPPDVGLSYLPFTPEWATERAIDFSEFLDIDRFREDFGDYLTDLMMVETDDGFELRMVPVNIGPKGLVFYAKPAFETAGYPIPETFEELVLLSEEIAATGQTPWCFNWEAGSFTGFPGSDLIEGMVARMYGVGVYDRWVAGELGFASPEVTAAAKQVERLLFSPGFVNGGTDSVTSKSWSAPLIELLDPHPVTGAPGPGCTFATLQHSAKNFAGSNTAFRARGVLGEDIGVFLLPPIAASDPVTITGAGSVAWATSDRPEVRALITFMASPVWGEVWAGIEADADESFISSNRRFRVDSYGSLRQFASDKALRIQIHELHHEALQAGTWRFDADLLMPDGFGNSIEGPQPSLFWRGMVDWVNQVKSIEEIFADLDSERPKYE